MMEALMMKETKQEQKYQRLEDRIKELSDLYSKDKNVKHLMEDDCICHFLSYEGAKTYETIAAFAKEHNIQRVVDIGCAYGHQSETFLQEGIHYIGVSDHQAIFWNKDKFPYFVSAYPCELPVQSGDLAISVLCLTWNCYLYEGEKTLIEQCEALQRDFDHCLLYIQLDRLEFISRYFKKTKQVKGNLYYFSNK